MYLENAINRINNIDWEIYGKKEINEQGLGYEYLKRIAYFFKNNAIRPINPLVANISSLLGYKQEFEIAEYCDSKVANILKDLSIPRKILDYYLQLSKYADIDEDKVKYLNVYEPLVQLIERGGNFSYREGGLMIYNSTFYPLNGWYDRFIAL